MKKQKKKSDVEDFIALPDAEKERIWESLNREDIPTRPLTPAERKLEAAVNRRAKKEYRLRQRGRPKVGEGSQKVQVTIERGLLRQADAYADQRGLTRAQLLAEGLRLRLTVGGPKKMNKHLETAIQKAQEIAAIHPSRQTDELVFALLALVDREPRRRPHSRTHVDLRLTRDPDGYLTLARSVTEWLARSGCPTNYDPQLRNLLRREHANATAEGRSVMIYDDTEEK